MKELLQPQSLDQSQDGSDYIYSKDVSISEETAIDKILLFSCFHTTPNNQHNIKIKDTEKHTI
jgi:hypothetical protein